MGKGEGKPTHKLNLSG